MGEKSMRYACTLTKGQEKIATGSVTVVCVGTREGGAMKARPIPPEIAGLFEVSAESGD
jgi:acyl-CoA thioesterase FadM